MTKALTIPWGITMNAIIDALNTIFWGYVLIYGLLSVGIFFTIRLGALQFLHFGEMIRSVLGARQSDKSGISPFQALCTSLASRVGTGNLAGVAVALYLGGAGAIFWMWMVALVGMAISALIVAISCCKSAMSFCSAVVVTAVVALVAEVVVVVPVDILTAVVVEGLG